MIERQPVLKNYNLLKTGLGMILVIVFMGVAFSFTIPLVYAHQSGIKANFMLWPIQQFVEIMVYQWFGLTGNIASSLAFFLAELPYVFLLIVLFSYMFNFARSFSTDDEISAWLANKNGFSGRIIGSLIGFISPFCSCSTIPIMTTLAKTKAPFGTVVAFLITSPMINETGVALMWSFFGYKVALIYIAFGIIIGLTGSYIASFLKLHDQFKIMPSEEQTVAMPININKRTVTFNYLHKRAWHETKKIFKKIWWIMIIALAVGALIHGYIPEAWIKANIGNNWWAPLIMVPIGMALYLDIVATLPIVNSFVLAGVGLGPALAFMMGVNTISVPSLIMLTKIFKRKFMIFLVIYLLLSILIFAYIIILIPDQQLL